MAIERSLAEQYRNLERAREERISRERAAEFAALDSPSREARFDPRLFLAKYFLGPNGAPDKEKQREPLILEDFDKSDFSKAVQAVPGLVARVTRRLTVVGWADTFVRGLDAAFATCSAPGAPLDIPTTEANFDLDRFMAKYFLDGLNGKPDPKKTTEPIELCPFFEHLPRLITVVDSIPGLHLIRVKGAWNSEYTIVGWDIAKVMAIKKGHEDKREREMAEKEAKKRAERQKCWHKALQPHRDYMKSYRPPAGPLKLDDLVGSYSILCEAIDEHLGNYHDDLTLEIQKPASANGVVAAFNLGLIEGTMLLALSDDALHRLREEQPPELAYHEEEEEEEDDDEDESDSYGSNSKKRKASGSPGGQAIRRRLGETPKPNRVYLQWGGRMVDAEIEVDEGDEHTGYLDFDASKATARGEWVYPAMWGKERKLAFSIYKRGDQPRETPRNWNYWTQKWYDIECRDRWGRR
ncbi:hypothetical protein IFM61606_00411 [Aspergillus udagawae]|uniref:Uncharacterized protein n=1 Tax=Aspergillus udagawae TaxID=91492 RepID=A0ABQ1ABQ8_9EURO|nr:hypothetical protein IFM51744_00694 [Aspergillus udagawae]GFF76082.1 hypothetical protein IFM53868_01744 [Aspergillus udagawae]GFG03572.1 hypothetical protein IFM5058_01500 [Aspergillus udagawae]GFG20214.1 hypothetical protein IFM61606_00411 [Aspergillus udagawae]